MSHRAGDPRLGYRRHGTHTDARNHLDYPASDRHRPFGHEESNRHVPNRNDKYYDMESNYRSRLTKDRHSSKDQESQDFESAAGSNHGSARFPFASPSEMHKQSGEGATYGKLNAAKTMSVDDEDMFLYGPETGSSSVYLKDYQHGQKESQKTSADDDGNNLGISEAGAVGKQDYDPTIENILKSIGFNIDLSSQVVTEPASKTETAVERKRAAAVQASESSMMASEALGISALRAGFSKKIDSILPAQETYEARARRYREEQTRLYAESNAGSDLVKATAPKLTPAVSGRSSLELLQSSYDYDAVVKEFAKEIEGKEIQQDNWAGNERETNSGEGTVDPAATSKAKRALYEDFSDSDDSEKSTQTETKKVVDNFEAESQQHPVAPSPRFHDETGGKSRRGSAKASRMRTIEPGHRNSKFERAERTSKSLREPEAAEGTQRQVKIIPSTPVSDAAGSGRNSSGSVRHAVGSRWDSPKKDEAMDPETGARIAVGPNMSEKRQSRIQGLHKELDRLKQEQKEVMRRKQRGRLGHKDPELLDNCRHQANIIAELNRLLKCTDEEFLALEAKKSSSTDRKVMVTNSRRKVESSSALTPEISSIKSENKSDVGQKDRPKLSKIVINYDYFDDGGHWCRSCNAIFNTIEELCQHLQSSNHYENLDLNHRPWAAKDTTAKKGCKGVPVPIKGVEFLMPSQAFYCSLCSVFSGDAECAYEHLKSNAHNESYQKFLENDTTYEHHYNLDKEAAMSGKMHLLNNKKDPKTERFGSSTKRPSFSRPSNENIKRTKLSAEFSEKSLDDDSSSSYVHDAKSDVAPADLNKVSSALSGATTHSDRRGSKAKDSAPSTLPPRTAVPQKKPAFIGKLPCLTGAKNRRSVSRLARTNGVDDKESNEFSDTKQTLLLHAAATSQAQDNVGESQNVVRSSKLCTSEDGLTSMKTSCPVPVDDSREQDDKISSAIGQRLAAIKSSSQSSVEYSTSQDERQTTDAKKNAPDSSSCVQEVMSIGDFEIFDECDAE